MAFDRFQFLGGTDEVVRQPAQEAPHSAQEAQGTQGWLEEAHGEAPGHERS
jgi:hypothetical protein